MRSLNFLHRQFHKVFPPPISSPYLYGRYGKVLRQTLINYASTAKVAVEFGIFHGYTTSLIANALPPGGKLYAYDINSLPVLAGKMRNNVQVQLEQKNIFNWLNDPFDFDLMWIDIAADPEEMRIIHERLRPFLADSVVLSEGTHRLCPERVIDVPHEEICSLPPGLFRLI